MNVKCLDTYIRDALIAALDKNVERAYLWDEQNRSEVAACYRSNAGYYRELIDKLAHGKLVVTEVA